MIHQIIAHAIWCLGDSSLAYELSWDKQNYLRQDTMGKCACITFTDNAIVGGFYNSKCARAKNQTYTANSWEQYFADAPSEIQDIARQETTQYLLDNLNSEEAYPYITTAFWQRNNDILSSDNPEHFMEYGGSILLTEMLTLEEALPVYEEEYEFEEIQITTLKRIFKLRIEISGKIDLNSDVYQKLSGLGQDNFEEFQMTLESLDFVFVE